MSAKEVNEPLYYQDRSVRITSVAAVFGAKTYAMTSIGSVGLKKQPANRSWGIITMIVGIIGVVVVILATLDKSFSYLFAAGGIGVSLIVTILGLAMLMKVKAMYTVRLTTNSGEIDALSSTEGDRCKLVVRAINAAILGQD